MALVSQARPDLSPSGMLAQLRATGKPITDTRNGVVTPRIDTLAAIQLPASKLSAYGGAAVSIPDGTGSATVTTTTSGFTGALGTVHVSVQIDHSDPSQLRLTLIGPDGTSVLLSDHTGSAEHPINAFYGLTDAPAQSLDAFIAQTDAVLAHDARDALGAIAAPTLITFGAHDIVCSTRFAEPLRSGIAQSEVVVFEHLSHAGLHENADEFNRATLEFLTRQRL